MKKILAMAAVAALATGASAYAANPFSDVSTSDWAYQAVSDLSDQGIVEGYPDGTFKGQSNITRYEMAQIIARLMAKEDQYNAEQRATIDKLAGEYADELDSLGVRVANLEKKVGNISWGGDARMRWNQSYDANGKADDAYNGRIRITAKGQVNDSTYVEGRFTSSADLKDGTSADTEMDQLLVHHQFGKNAGISLGRIDYFAGQTGLFYDDELDGAIASFGNISLSLDLGYGRMKAWDLEADGSTEPEVFLARVYGTASRFTYDAEYYHVAKNSAFDDKADIVGAGLSMELTDDLYVIGDYYQNTTADNDPKAWTAGIGYGHNNVTVPGSFGISAQYVKAEQGAYLGGTTFTVSGPLDQLLDGKNEAKFWLAQADYTLAKNVKLHGEYAFNVKVDDDSDYDDLATVSLNYYF